jgi:hypothetical protein
VASCAAKIAGIDVIGINLEDLAIELLGLLPLACLVVPPALLHHLWDACHDDLAHPQYDWLI